VRVTQSKIFLVRAISLLTTVGVLAAGQLPSASASPGTPINLVSPIVPAYVYSGEKAQGLSGTWSASPKPKFEYQWFKCPRMIWSSSSAFDGTCQTIPGARGKSFVPTLDELGSYLMLGVEARNKFGSTWHYSATSLKVDVVSPPAVEGMWVDTFVAQANPGRWASGSKPKYLYQWATCRVKFVGYQKTLPSSCSKISAATKSKYRVQTSDVGKFLTFSVRQKGANPTTELWAPASRTLEPVLGISSPPEVFISGGHNTPSTLSKLTVWQGQVLGVRETLTYKWARCTTHHRTAPQALPSDCTYISGANSDQLVLNNTESGKYIISQVTVGAKDGFGVSRQLDTFSVSTPAVIRMPTPTARPTYDGIVTAGAELSGFAGAWDLGTASITWSYLWWGCSGPIGNNTVEIPTGCSPLSSLYGANTLSLTIPETAAGSYILLVETAITPAGQVRNLSLSDGIATGAPIPYTPSVSYTGTARVGGVLTASPMQWKGYPAPTVVFKWFECSSRYTSQTSNPDSRGCALVLESTSSAFTIPSTTRGKYVMLVIEATNSLGSWKWGSAAPTLVG
jgi:hypothetical protein